MIKNGIIAHTLEEVSDTEVNGFYQCVEQFDQAAPFKQCCKFTQPRKIFMEKTDQDIIFMEVWLNDEEETPRRSSRRRSQNEVEAGPEALEAHMLGFIYGSNGLKTGVFYFLLVSLVVLLF